MKKAIGYICALLSMLFILYQKRDAVIGIAVVLAYTTGFTLLLSPLCTRMEKRGMRVSHAASAAVAGLFLAVCLLLAALIPYLITQSMYLIKKISPVAIELAEKMKAWSNEAGFMKYLFSETGRLYLPFAEMTGKLAQTGMDAAAQIGRIGFALVLTHYVLCDRQRLSRHLLLCLPTVWRIPVQTGIRACANAVMGYFSGVLKTSLFVSIATYAGLVLLGVQDALLLSLFMGFMEILPYIGPVIASIPILLSALAQGGEKLLLVFSMIVLVQQIEGNFVSPHFTASSTSIRPLAAILGVFTAGSLFGMTGILLAIPLMVLGQSIFCSFRQAQIAFKERATICAEKIYLPDD